MARARAGGQRSRRWGGKNSGNTGFHDGALARVLLAPFKLGFALTLGLAGLLLVAWTVD